MRFARKLRIAVALGLFGAAAVAQQTPQPAQQNSTQTGELQVLTDTHGVDLLPYVQASIKRIADSWHKIVPEGPQRNRFRKANVSIDFVVWRDGSVHGLRFDPVSNDPALDRTCWDAILKAAPFEKLPAEFKGPHIAVQFHLNYQPPPKK